MNLPLRPRTRRGVLATRAQERREILRRSEAEPASDPAAAREAVLEHLTEARVAALGGGMVIIAAEVSQVIRLLEQRRGQR